MKSGYSGQLASEEIRPDTAGHFIRNSEKSILIGFGPNNWLV